jgi:cobalt-zinc-cadmium efflux system outer membrane protein
MYRLQRRICLGLLHAAFATSSLLAQQSFTWQQIRDRFERNNPTLKAGQIGIDESKAEEITAYLRPNPNFTFSADGTQIAPYQGIWRPFSGTTFVSDVSYLHERQHKRELRRDSAQQGTQIVESDQLDVERNLLFGLRDAFVRTLQAKAILEIAQQNLDYYDRVLATNRHRFKAGDISQIDLTRLELQRVQFLSDVTNAQVNLRTAKVELLAILNDKMPVDSFDASGNFDFNSDISALPDIRKIALDTRPDLRAALQSVEKARTDHELAVTNGSTDPTFAGWWTHNGSFNNPNAYDTLGAAVSIPLRIFDRNQGEKLRTQLDIDRNERLRDAAETGVLKDVDSAYATLMSTLALLKPYKETYLKQAVQVRDTVSFAYGHGAASLLDFLDAQKSYRDVQLNYLTLVGSYLSAANQLNLSVGREVIQ